MKWKDSVNKALEKLQYSEESFSYDAAFSNFKKLCSHYENFFHIGEYLYSLAVISVYKSKISAEKISYFLDGSVKMVNDVPNSYGNVIIYSDVLGDNAFRRIYQGKVSSHITKSKHLRISNNYRLDITRQGYELYKDNHKVIDTPRGIAINDYFTMLAKESFNNQIRRLLNTNIDVDLNNRRIIFSKNRHAALVDTYGIKDWYADAYYSSLIDVRHGYTAIIFNEHYDLSEEYKEAVEAILLMCLIINENDLVSYGYRYDLSKSFLEKIFARSLFK